MLEKILNAGKKLVVGGLIFSTIFLGCKKEEDIVPLPDPEPTEETILHEKLKVLSSEETTKILPYKYGEDLKFSENMNFEKGNILAVGKTDNTPYGILAEIYSVKEGGKSYEIEFVNLYQVIEKGEFNLSTKITDGKKTPNGRIEFPIEDFILYDQDGNSNTTTDQVKMNGIAYFSPNIIFDAKWNKGLKYFEFGFESEVGAEMDIETGLEGLQINEFHYFDPIYLPSFPANVCGVPIVLTPKLEFDIGFEGYISPTEISVSENIHSESKIMYEGGSWDFESNTTENFNLENFAKPEQMEIRAHVKPSLHMIINYFYGPYASVEGYVKANADHNANPPWEISAGMDLYLGGSAKFFGITVVDYNKQVWGLEKILAQGEPNENNLPHASFNVEPETGNTETNFTFDASSSYDIETSTENLQVKWDWESDGNWDTDYTTNKIATKKFANAGEKNISLMVKDEGGLENSVSKILNVEEDVNSGTFIDPRNGEEYNIVKIGDDWWFAENLNYYTSNSEQGDFGKYYDRSDSRGVCPNGWHLPSLEEFTEMFEIIDPEGSLELHEDWGKYAGNAGEMLKEFGHENWASPNYGIDLYGFRALPLEKGGEHGYYWTSSNFSVNPADSWIIRFSNWYPGAYLFGSQEGSEKMPLRCIKD